jgi:hypothetical protein
VPVTGADPLNSTFRSRITRFLQAGVRAWSTPSAPTAPSVGDVAYQVAMATLQRTSALRAAAGGHAPRVVEGAGWPVMLDPVLRFDDKQQQIWGSDEARFGRVTTNYGINPQAWTGESATNITLERVAAYHYEADTQGLLYNKADLDFGVNRKDGTIQAAQRARTAPVYRARLQFAPADPSPLAHAVCAVVRRVVDTIPGFQAAEEKMLSAAAHGYSGLELVYRYPAPLSVAISSRRTTTIQDAITIDSLEWVHPRDFRWMPLRRGMVLDSGGGRWVNPFERPDGTPTDKLLFHSAAGLGDPHQLGYDFAAVPLHLLKFQSIARWSVMLEFFGIATPYLVYGSEGFANDQDIAGAKQFLGLIGRGKPALLSEKFGKVEMTPTPTGIDARGQHAAIIGVVNAELLKLIQAQVLSSEVGGSASYALANVQADSKEEVQRQDAALEADTMTHQFIVFIVRQNLRQMARAFGATPAQIMSVAPRAYRVVDRQQDPAARLKLCTDFAAGQAPAGDAPSKVLRVDFARLAEELSIPVVQDEPGEDLPEVAQEPDGDEAELDLSPDATAAIITVNEARAQTGLPPWPDADGDLTIAEFTAKHSGVVSAAADAADGTKGEGSADGP